MIFDTHAHYDDERFDADRDETLSALPKAGIGRVLVPGVSLSSSQKAIALARKWDFVDCAAGIHPHEAAAGQKELPALERLLADAEHHGIVAVGECGLDYHYDFCPRDVQRALLDAQLSLALRHGLPVILHVREAMEDCLDILRAYPALRCVFHCFSESAEQAVSLVSAGHMISFTGVITYKNAAGTRRAAAAVPEDALLVETDAPYLAPVPLRGKRCDSRMLRHTIDALAVLRGTDAERLEELTSINGSRFFGR